MPDGKIHPNLKRTDSNHHNIFIKAMENGFIQIYTGDGKGKTTAALGLALRAAGAGLKTLIIQFMKEGFSYSELTILKPLAPMITVEQYGDDAHVLQKRRPTARERAAAGRGLERAAEALTGGGFDIVILDEVCVAVHFGLLTEGNVTVLFNLSRSSGVELLLTGRYCPEAWIERADLVTEMREVKHYFQKGVVSRKGIDS